MGRLLGIVRQSAQERLYPRRAASESVMFDEGWTVKTYILAVLAVFLAGCSTPGGRLANRIVIVALGGYSSRRDDVAPRPGASIGLAYGTQSDYRAGFIEGYRGCAGAGATPPTVPNRPNSVGTPEQVIQQGVIDGYRLAAQRLGGCR